ncbi:Putative SNU66/SART1 family protein [Septoria linicola]|uniref:SNU66/SART1 family protein n=1 Tax=Septoria linicola TaxID=215465 RepID=A0A9Q9AJU5_9PEZI|nr:putative SNU66/SART1 family protein [Septoria linicola]USW47755.1 Putative SNU66/SART1 family protein [Septoria linicola]
MASSADIVEMNKVRVSLGMAPLPVPGNDGPQFKDDSDSDSAADDSDDLSTLDKRAAAAGKNWARHEAERRQKEERQKRKDATKKARDQAARFAKLEGKGLGEADEEEEVDTRTWLLQQKKRQKKIDKLRKLEEELAAREQQVEYTARDLAGVKVGHEAAEFDEFTGEQVLTLKDQEIGDESEDDELENTDMKAKEKLEEKLRLLKKRPDYDPTEQDGTQNLLSKYDEEIDGKQQKRFTLDGQGNTIEAKRKAATEEAGTSSKSVKISLDMLKDDAPTSDYVDPSTIKVKKAKKSKKEKKTRQKAADEDDVAVTQTQDHQNDSMDIDATESADTVSKTKKRAFDDYIDDDELQASLAASRREANKKRKKIDATELARQLKEQMPVDEAEPEEGGLVIDETSEFVANLKRPEETEEPIIRRNHAQQNVSHKIDTDEDGDVAMAQESYADVEQAQERAERATSEAMQTTERTATGLEEEENMVGQGIGASLAMLRKRGLIDNSESDQKAEKERKRAQFLADKQYLIDEYDHKAREQREADRRSGRYDTLSNRDRDAMARQQNEQREQFIARLLADKFNREYRPEVKLQYHDEHGREMNQKEAFKHLSHAFHGKGSGKQKTEKLLKKMEDEKRNVSKNILNIGDEAGFSNVGQAQGKRQKTAGVRLQ